jgi:hypothetical protein
MFINNILILVIIFNVVTSSSLNNNFNNFNNNLKNTYLRLFIFGDKNNYLIFKNFNKLKRLYYNKAMVSLSDGITNYNTLSEEDKIIIETILSLCY